MNAKKPISLICASFLACTMNISMSDMEVEYPDFTTPDEMSSLTLVLEGQKIYVHREVLAAWSPVFKSMFTRDFKGLKLYIT